MSKLKKFCVNATMYTDLYLIVEAEDEDAAYAIAREADGAEFTDYGGFSGGWDVSSEVHEITSEELKERDMIDHTEAG